jgi:hypothetical protein
MHKIDGDGATVDNEFTEGNPGLSVPATTVTSAWANAVQREIVAVVEEAGLTLFESDDDTGEQMLAAILELIRRGGTAAPVSISVSNNQSSAADVTGFPEFLTTAVRGVEFLYQVVRHTADEELLQSGRVHLNWNPNTSAWTVSKLSLGDTDEDDAIDVVDFFMTATGDANEYKLQYKTSNMAGASYAGTLRITDIKTILV